MAKPIRIYSDVDPSQFLELHASGETVTLILGEEGRVEEEKSVEFCLADLEEITATLQRLVSAAAPAPASR